MYTYILKKRLFFALQAGILIFITGCFSPSVRYSSLDSDEKESGRTGGADRKNAGRDGTDELKDGRLKEAAESYIGVPYRYGGMSRKGVDCSGLVCLIFRDVYGIDLPRSSRSQFRKGRPVPRRFAREGDLVFFRGGRPYRINHVGIYLGGDRFIHSSSREGVIYSSLEKKYFKRHFAGIRRID